MTSLVPLSQKPRITRFKYKMLKLLFDAASLNFFASFLSLQGAHPPVIWPTRGVEQVGNYVFIGFLSLGLGTICALLVWIFMFMPRPWRGDSDASLPSAHLTNK